MKKALIRNLLPAISFGTAILAPSCCPPFCGGNDYIPPMEDGAFLVPKCKPLIRYSGKSFLVESVSVPGSEGATSVGKIEIKDQQIQQAGEIAQVADIHRMAVCQTLPVAGQLGKEDMRRAIEQMRNDQTVVTQFYVAAIAGGDALTRFIERYEPRRSAIAKEVAKVEGPSDSITLSAVKNAAIANPEVKLLKDAGNEDYRASTVTSNEALTE
jgi:hypothetical protein